MKFRLTLAYLAWIGVVGFGMWKMLEYEKTPGEPAYRESAGAGEWPAGARTRPEAGRMRTLVMFVHPQCACTAATIGELSLIMAQCAGKLAARVYFLDPEGYSESWTKTSLWKDAGRIPGVTAALDRGGETARVFGATTSGQCLLYDDAGRLLFQGGITGSRGHAGDNAGRRSITSIVNGSPPAARSTFVYGCRLFNEVSDIKGVK